MGLVPSIRFFSQSGDTIVPPAPKEVVSDSEPLVPRGPDKKGSSLTGREVPETVGVGTDVRPGSRALESKRHRTRPRGATDRVTSVGSPVMSLSSTFRLCVYGVRPFCGGRLWFGKGGRVMTRDLSLYFILGTLSSSGPVGSRRGPGFLYMLVIHSINVMSVCGSCKCFSRLNVNSIFRHFSDM